ncbi:uncharacterized protein LOC132034124 isoform X2 [Lycium ferocissimum]|uniref:uncharacterized protein LOC132034124 isoform X2 n=1 Tax=Lycium ferocissimum TaxID=112874 RepID=UPI002815A493|nr:uncharacterized protein LOC132034124 isoform X2 [Lycium ferocissimum]
MHKVQRWRTALTQLANLKGCDILNRSSYGTMVESIRLSNDNESEKLSKKLELYSLPECNSEFGIQLLFIRLASLWDGHKASGKTANDYLKFSTFEVMNEFGYPLLYKESIGPAGTAWKEREAEMVENNPCMHLVCNMERRNSRRFEDKMSCSLLSSLVEEQEFSFCWSVNCKHGFLQSF